MEFRGWEYSRVTRGSGDSERTYSATHDIYRHEGELTNAKEFYMGQHRLPFNFTLPEGLAPSYNGSHGWIRHTVEAKIEVSWARDPRDSVEISIPMLVSGIVPESEFREATIEHDEEWLLRLQTPNDVINLGDRFTFKLVVSKKTKVNGIRVEIVHREYVAPEGEKETTDKAMNWWTIKGEELPRDVWLDVWLDTHPSWPAPFQSELIRNEYWLKVKLDIPLRIDKSIEIPLKAWPKE
jgi:hypothetical protein